MPGADFVRRLMSLQLAARLFPTVGTVLSLAALAYSLNPSGTAIGGWSLAALGASVLFGIAAIGTDVRSYLDATPQNFHSAKSIRNYMYRWIDQGGRVVIFSHDLSWVVDDEMRALLRTKSENHELTLVLPADTDLSTSLRRWGSDVITYSEFDYTIKSRFTIVNLDRTDARVAIGHRVSAKRHEIQEFSAGTDPAFYLALDLVELMRRIHGQSNAIE